MQIISTREFRANQKNYFELAGRESVCVTCRNARPVLIHVCDEDDLLDKQELMAIKMEIPAV